MRVLVIEDEHRIAQTIKKGLEQERYVVDVAHTGPEGLDLANSGSFDLILLDVMLPGLDGFSVCRHIRQAQIHTPILMLTAKGQLQDKVKGLDAGADDYLAKPFSFAELLARLRALARRPHRTISDQLSFDDLRMDRSGFQVERAGVKIKLSQKEFALLEYLLRHPRRILSKDQIMTHVWSYDADILPNTVEAYIRLLRNKIDRPFADRPPLIQTVRGFGYRLGEKN